MHRGVIKYTDHFCTSLNYRSSCRLRTLNFLINKSHMHQLAMQAKAMCRDPGSNRGPSDLQSDALPTELLRLCLQKSEGRSQDLANSTFMLNASVCGALSATRGSSGHKVVAHIHHIVHFQSCIRAVVASCIIVSIHLQNSSMIRLIA